MTTTTTTTTNPSSSQTLIARDLLNKNILNAATTTLQQQQQQQQQRPRPLDAAGGLGNHHQFFQGVASNSLLSNNFNMPPQNLINVPFFKSISIQPNGNNGSISNGVTTTTTTMTQAQSQPMDSTTNQDSSKQQPSLNV